MEKNCGTIYLNNGRYWWKVRLPGQKKQSYFALKPAGAKFATKDFKVAQAVATEIWRDHLGNAPVNWDGKLATLVQMYYHHCQAHYGKKSDEPNTIRQATFPVAQYFPSLLADDFTPRHLKEFRAKAVKEFDWSRKTANRRIAAIRRMFKWAVSESLISTYTHTALMAVEGLRKGRSIVIGNISIVPRETQRKKAVPLDVVEKTLPFLSKVVADMARLQMVSGMRSTELCLIRPCDIDMTDDIWIYRPKNPAGQWDFKGQWRENVEEKEICLGPQAQAIIQPYLFRPVAEYLFKPAEAEQQIRKMRYTNRKTPLHRGNRAGTNNKNMRLFNDQYNRNSYRRAIERACRQAYPPPEHLRPKEDESKRAFNTRLIDAEKAELKEWHKKHTWHPHQLRHTATTLTTIKLGKDAAQAYIGHADKSMTELYSQEARLVIAKEAAREVG